MNTLVKALMVICLFTNTHTLWAQNNYLYTYAKETNMGDNNQALGIARSLKTLLPTKNFEEKNVDIANQQNFLADIASAVAADPQNKVIVIAAGTPTVETLKEIPHNSNVIVVYSSHQLTADHTSLKDKVDLIALPKHALSDQEINDLTTLRTTVVTTPGVAHNLTPAIIKEEYEKNKIAIPVATNYIGVILGGDAPTKHGKMLYYTPEEAEKLATYIHQHFDLNKVCLLILNGRRTGEHDPKTNEVFKNSHRDGTLDFVTAAFIKALEQYGYKKEQHFKLFDFQYGTLSYYKAVLGALLETKSPLLVAGDSSSMVSEAADCLPSGSVTAYFNNAMNETHTRQCEEENKAGRINILFQSQAGEWILQKATPPNTEGENQPASQIIAEAIKVRLK